MFQIWRNHTEYEAKTLLPTSEFNGREKFAWALLCQDIQLWRKRGTLRDQSWALMLPHVSLMGRAIIPFHTTKPWLSIGWCSARAVWGMGPAHDQTGEHFIQGQSKLSSKQWGSRQVYRTNTCTPKQNSEEFSLCLCMCCDTIRLSLSGLEPWKVLRFLRSRKTMLEHNDFFYLFSCKEDICNFSWHIF